MLLTKEVRRRTQYSDKGTWGVEKHLNFSIFLWIEIELWILMSSFLGTMSSIQRAMKSFSNEWDFIGRTWRKPWSILGLSKLKEKNRPMTVAKSALFWQLWYNMEVESQMFLRYLWLSISPRKFKAQVIWWKQTLNVSSRLIWVTVFLKRFLSSTGPFWCILTRALVRGIGKIRGGESVTQLDV